MRRRKRYMITAVRNGTTVREVWLMERPGKISIGDIKRIEKELAQRWPVNAEYMIVTNVVELS